jgi:hypothetical protein
VYRGFKYGDLMGGDYIFADYQDRYVPVLTVAQRLMVYITSKYLYDYIFADYQDR